MAIVSPMKNKPFDLNKFGDEVKQYIVEQDYDLYTPIDHASWRYIMRVNKAFFTLHGHPKYLDGLKNLGISIERIPKIEDMDLCLQKFGWRAIPVSGFIPPAVFLEVQANGVLPIACDMRSVEHIAYTPAPDIVHEAAGHAPMIVDSDYAEYLRTYGEISENAIFSKEDLDVYDAILHLSITKEDPSATAEQILAAQSRLDQTLATVTYTSEATMLTRMAWWSTEYGLVGPSESPLIYGAGLLSSAGESFECLNPHVTKIPFSLDCTLVNFDITKPQPQLFQSPDFATLHSVVHEFSRTMAYKIGGLNGLAKAKIARTVTATQLDSGVQIGGILKEIHNNSTDGIYYLQFEGPCQLAYQKKQLHEQGPKYHQTGYGTPVGLIKDLNKSAADLSLLDLESLGFKGQNKGQIQFQSGVVVEGVLTSEISIDNKKIVLSFKDCKVSSKDKVLFDPSWGIYDMACGDQVVSVFGGAPDRSTYFAEVGVRTPAGKAKTNLTEKNKDLCELYSQVRKMREEKSAGEASLTEIQSKVEKHYPTDWLLTMEIYELAEKNNFKDVSQKSFSRLIALQDSKVSLNSETKSLIERGFKVLMT